MEGNNISSFQNLCKIFAMRIKLDKEKKVKTPNEVIDNYEKYAKKIDNIYNKEFEKEIRSLITPEVTLEEEEERLKKLISLLEERLDKRRILEDEFYNSTGRYIDGFQLIVSEEELDEKKNRLELISKYLTTKNEIDEINISCNKLRNSLTVLYNTRDEYTKKNKEIEDSLYSFLVRIMKKDEYFNKINEDNYSDELVNIESKVRENEETLEVTLDSVQSLISSGTSDDYTSYIEDAEKSYYIWKNREIILKIYELVISFEDDFEQLCVKREKINDLLEDRKHIKNKLHIEDTDELIDFDTIIKEQENLLNKEREVLDNIINYDSRIKFKEERLNELEEINNSYEILTILREYGIIESYDLEEEEIPDVVEDTLVEEEKIVVPAFEDIVNDVIDPYRIKEIVDYPKTLNLGLAKLKGESVRESVNKKLNPKPRESIFDDFARDTSDNIEPVLAEENKDLEPVVEENTKEEEKTEEINTESINEVVPPLWELPKDTTKKDIKKEEETNNEEINNVPIWNVLPDNNNIEEINKVSINEPINDNNFWIPVSDSKLETKDFPNINIPINTEHFSSESDNFGFPDII